MSQCNDDLDKMQAISSESRYQARQVCNFLELTVLRYSCNLRAPDPTILHHFLQLRPLPDWRRILYPCRYTDNY